eukprot:6001475-Prymnesium_polylepis.2
MGDEAGVGSHDCGSATGGGGGPAGAVGCHSLAWRMDNSPRLGQNTQSPAPCHPGFVQVAPTGPSGELT